MKDDAQMSPTSRDAFFLVLLLLHVTGVDATLNVTRVVIKAGDTVTLSCGEVNKENNSGCPTWLFSAGTATVTVYEYDKFHLNVESRLKVLENGSLVITNVTVQDVGLHSCRRFNKSTGKQVSEIQTELSVVSMTPKRNDKEMTVKCSVSTRSRSKCDSVYTVNWLSDNNQHQRRDSSGKSSCEKSAVFPLSSTLMSCKVTDVKTKEEFTFTLQLTPEKSDWWWWWLYVPVAAVVAVVVAAALLTFVVLKRKRTKGKKTQMNVDDADPEEGVAYASISYTKKTSANTQADPEEGVAYASISYTKKTSANAQALRKRQDENVTYSTVM